MRKIITHSFKEFTTSEKNAGLVLLFCTLASMLLANSFIGNSYLSFWDHIFDFKFYSFSFHITIKHIINDGLMTIFFLMVGLEIERELYAGELNPIKNALLPVIAAIGGMLMPALIFYTINYRVSTVNGFGIPMGTDIAFALAILSLAGKKVPLAIKVLLTAIAIIDDLGSILIIAIFYGSNIQYDMLLLSVLIFAFLIVLNLLKIRFIYLYLLLGIVMWFFMLQSGIHPTISGVLLAFAIPFENNQKKSISIKLQHQLHIPVAFIILPLFTLVNTAIPLKFEYVSNMVSPHAIGILLGLLIGKPLGIIISVFSVIKLNIVSIPKNLVWFDIIALGCLAGIGFTMSIFITQLAFNGDAIIQSSKLMILFASSLSAIVGLILFKYKYRKV